MGIELGIIEDLFFVQVCQTVFSLVWKLETRVTCTNTRLPLVESPYEIVRKVKHDIC